MCKCSLGLFCGSSTIFTPNPTIVLHGGSRAQGPSTSSRVLSTFRDNLAAACKCRKGKGLYSPLSSKEAPKGDVRMRTPKSSLLTSDVTWWPPANPMKAMCLSTPHQQPGALHSPVISAWKIALSLRPQQLEKLHRDRNSNGSSQQTQCSSIPKHSAHFETENGIKSFSLVYVYIKRKNEGNRHLRQAEDVFCLLLPLLESKHLD